MRRIYQPILLHCINKLGAQKPQNWQMGDKNTNYYIVRNISYSYFTLTAFGSLLTISLYDSVINRVTRSVSSNS